MIAAQYNNISIQIPEFNLGTDNKTESFLSKSPFGKIPVLETPNGCITESNAIARYIARMRNDTGLYGNTFFESAQVDQWIDICSNSIELPATLWIYSYIGTIPPLSECAQCKVKSDLAKALSVLENVLSDKTYLVGDRITLADITISTTLLYPFKWVCGPAYRSNYPNVMRWFDTCVNQPQFRDVISNVVLATDENREHMAPVIPTTNNNVKEGKQKANNQQPKKQGESNQPKQKEPKPPKEPKQPKPPAPPKEQKKKAKEEDEEEDYDDVPKEKKPDHPFKLLDISNPTPFQMDAWKRCYSNCHGDYTGAMTTFWETIDLNCWSIFRGDYNYYEELKVLFMASNLIAGFIQRTDDIRKWLFGTMVLKGVEGQLMKITCYYLIRGQDIQPLIACNDDAACYTWTRISNNGVVSEADKQLLLEYWSADVDEIKEGDKVLDSRCYK